MIVMATIPGVDTAFTVDTAILDLPYDKISAESPVTVYGDVQLDKQFINGLDLSNVIIDGDFDCSNQKTVLTLPRRVNGGLICDGCAEMQYPDGRYAGNKKLKVSLFQENKSFPDGVTYFSCVHTIKDLSDLLNMQLPTTLKTIVVSSSLLNRVKKDATMRATALQFMAKYPSIKIMDDKDREMSEMVQPEPVGPEKKKAPARTVPTGRSGTPVKTHTDCDKNDIMALCEQDAKIQSLGVSATDISRAIRTVTSPKNIGMKKYTRKHQNGNDVACVHRDKLPDIINGVIDYLCAQIEKNTQKDQPQNKQSVPAQPAPVVASVAPKSGNPAVEIKKYIPKSIWATIRRLCGNDVAKQKTILEKICSVNMNPVSPDQALSSSLTVWNVQKNKPTTVQCLRREKGNAVVQSVDTTFYKDRKRIIWTFVSDANALVCIAGVAEHSSGLNGLYYNNTLLPAAAKGRDAKGTPITPDMLAGGDYWDANVLLQEYGQTNPEIIVAPEPDAATTEYVAPDDACAAPRSVTPPVETVAPKTQPDEQPKNAVAEPAAPQPQTPVAKPVAMDAQPTPVQKIAPKPQTIIPAGVPQNFFDVVALSVEINALIDILDAENKRHIQVITNESDAGVQLASARAVQENLLKKHALQQSFQQIQGAMNKINEIKTLMNTKEH